MNIKFYGYVCVYVYTDGYIYSVYVQIHFERHSLAKQLIHLSKVVHFETLESLVSGL